MTPRFLRRAARRCALQGGARSAAFALALAFPGAASAQGTPAWPSKPVTIIVALSPGAATDIEARMYAQKMSENIGRPVVVDYRPGAGSTIGTHYVVKSPIRSS